MSPSENPLWHLCHVCGTRQFTYRPGLAPQRPGVVARAAYSVAWQTAQMIARFMEWQPNRFSHRPQCTRKLLDVQLDFSTVLNNCLASLAVCVEQTMWSSKNP